MMRLGKDKGNKNGNRIDVFPPYQSDNDRDLTPFAPNPGASEFFEEAIEERL